VADDVGEALLQLGEHLRLRGAFLLRGQDLLFPDAEHVGRREQEADRVEEDRVGSGDRRDQSAGDARPGYLRRGHRRLELRVALDEARAVDERRQVRLVGDVEEHREHSDHELDREQVPHLEDAERPQQGDRCEQEGPRGVRDDQDRAPLEAVDPDACG
jgi:hypothetical protein